MILVDGYGQEYGGFTLDTRKIKSSGPSLREDRVELPYTGKVPKQFEGCTNTRIYLMAIPFDVRVSLRADRGDELVFANVDAEPREVRDILDQVFSTGNRGKTGLTPYWEGTWSAHYFDWRCVEHERARLAAKTTPGSTA